MPSQGDRRVGDDGSGRRPSNSDTTTARLEPN
jgi:hypothetical protein